jgi:uncharacterized protein (TIGR03084 family)
MKWVSMADIRQLVADLEAEVSTLAELVMKLADDEWEHDTPASGWTVAHQVAHLAHFDQVAALAISDQARFQIVAAEAAPDPQGYGAKVLLPYLARGPRELSATWVEAARHFRTVALRAEPGLRAPWFGLSMSVASLVTARTMETWAHGQDIRDTVGLPPASSDRLKSIVHLAIGARPYSYGVHDLAPVSTPIRLELAAPDGSPWRWGPEDAVNVIYGSALDFCLVLTQRRNVLDTDLRASGRDAAEWLAIGQTFAGKPGAGRRPGQFNLAPRPGPT